MGLLEFRVHFFRFTFNSQAVADVREIKAWSMDFQVWITQCGYPDDTKQEKRSKFFERCINALIIIGKDEPAPEKFS
jgi:hypothetical protein